MSLYRHGHLARFVRRARFEPFHSSGRVFSHLTAGDSSEPGKYNIILSRGEVADRGWGRGGGGLGRGAVNRIILCKPVPENTCLFTEIQRNPIQLYYLRCFTNQSCIYIKNDFFY